MKHSLGIVTGGAALAAMALAMTWAGPAAAADSDALLSRINLPPGFRIGIFAHVPNARSMAVDTPANTIFVGSRRRTLYGLRDTDGDGVADTVTLLADDLNVPNGIAVRDGTLFVAENDRVFKWAVPAASAIAPPLRPRVTVMDGLPAKSHHGWRYAGFGPDGKLYVSIGSPCNICMPRGLEGTIIRMDADGGNREVVARGIRNSVGFDFNPVTGDLYFTDNGADLMGDDIPPDELNHVTKAGQHFGFPYRGGASVILTGMKGKTPPDGIRAPVINFQAHTANLGIHFYTGAMFPAEYRNDAFVAQHGSWNRSTPVGYRIMRIRFDAEGNATGKEVFADGWLLGSGVAGRPVDIKELPDGSLLVSDDYADVIYRITYGN